MTRVNWQHAAERERRKLERETARQKFARYDCRTLNGAINFLTRKKLTRYLAQYSILRTAKKLRITAHRVRRMARKHGIPLPTSRPFPKSKEVQAMHRLRKDLQNVQTVSDSLDDGRPGRCAYVFGGTIFVGLLLLN